MGQLRDQLTADLKIAGYSPSTQTSYLYDAQKCATYFTRSPAKMGAGEVRKYAPRPRKP